MDAVKDFVLWCVDTVPSVLLEPPVNAFLGLTFLSVTVRLFKQMIHL